MAGMGVTERHNGIWGERKSNQLGDANFMEHQLRRVFLWHFFEKRKQQSCSSSVGVPLVEWPHCNSEMPPFSLHQPQQHWAQALMGWHLLYACPRPHWGNEAVSVCCSGRLYVPFITVIAQILTKRESLGVGGLCCPICPSLVFMTTGPTWRVPHPGPIHLHLCLSGIDSLCIGSLRLPRYVSMPLTGARVELLTRQWREIRDGQCLTSEWPTHVLAWPHSPKAPCAFVGSGLIF